MGTRAGMTDDDDGDEQLERAEAAQAVARGHHEAAKSETASKTAEFSSAEAALQVVTSDAQRAAAVLTEATEKAEQTHAFKAKVGARYDVLLHTCLATVSEAECS